MADKRNLGLLRIYGARQEGHTDGTDGWQFIGGQPDRNQPDPLIRVHPILSVVIQGHPRADTDAAPACVCPPRLTILNVSDRFPPR